MEEFRTNGLIYLGILVVFIFGQLRLVFANLDIEEINTDRDKFLMAVSSNVEGENLSRITIANSEADSREKQAIADKIAISAEKIQAAKALE